MDASSVSSSIDIAIPRCHSSERPAYLLIPEIGQPSWPVRAGGRGAGPGGGGWPERRVAQTFAHAEEGVGTGWNHTCLSGSRPKQGFAECQPPDPGRERWLAYGKDPFRTSRRAIGP